MKWRSRVATGSRRLWQIKAKARHTVLSKKLHARTWDLICNCLTSFCAVLHSIAQRVFHR